MSNYYNSNYNSNNSQTGNVYPENMIILLVHGLSSTAEGMQKLADNIMSLGSIINYYNLVDLKTNINQFDNEISDVYVKIRQAFTSKPNGNVMVRVSFTNDETDSVDNQTDELFNIVSKLKHFFPSKKIVTIGHSKGGVVSMNCAIKHPGYITKLISVGTPYTTTIFDHLYAFVIEMVEKKCLKTIDFIYENNSIFMGSFVIFAKKIIENTIYSLFKSIINTYVTKDDLKQRWNRLSNKPKFTPIATRALILDGDKESDFAVPVESALAEGFNGKSLSDGDLLVKNDSFKITLTATGCSLLNNVTNILDTICSFSSASNIIEIFNFLSTLSTFLLSASNENPYVKRCTARYVHANMPVICDYLGSTNECLNNPDVAIKVLAGLND